MSIAIMAAVWKCGPADPTDRFVLLSIADNADETGFAYPRIGFTAARVCASGRTILRCLKKLAGEGWLAIQHHANNGRGNTYQIDLEKLGLVAGLPRLVPTRPTPRERAKTGDNASPGQAKIGDTVSPEIGDNLSPKKKSHVTSETKIGDKRDIPPDPLFGRTVIEPSEGGSAP